MPSVRDRDRTRQTAPPRSRISRTRSASRPTAGTCNDALSNGRRDFTLVDVRSPDLYANGHAPGAVNIPARKLIESTLNRYPRETIFVVYCAGPHCNGANRAAVRLARLGRPVKIMIGGMTGWLDEGFRTETGSAPPLRSCFRMTSFRPDQVSSTAQTLMSTSPSGSATSRTVSSVMSVATFDAFFGQEIQIAASCCIFGTARAVLLHAWRDWLRRYARRRHRRSCARASRPPGAARAARRSDRSGDEEQRAAGLDPELLRQRRARVAGHVRASF